VHGGSALKGRSVCPQCGHTLGLIELIPILSWLLLRGRCRHCKAKISIRYLLVELLMAALFALIVWQYGISVQAATYLILCCILLGLSLVDLETFTIPNGFILAAAVLWLASVWFMYVPLSEFAVGSLFAGSTLGYGFLPVLLDGLVGAVAIGGGILAFSLLFDRLTGRNSLGGGDVKLFFVVGLYLGLFIGLFNLLLSCILGLIFSVFWATLKTAKDEKQQKAAKPFPFGPSIAAATLVSLLIGSPCLTWYIDLFM
jgi:leader peptidase (prepilin peptidase)/N-methyltransferase